MQSHRQLCMQSELKAGSVTVQKTEGCRHCSHGESITEYCVRTIYFFLYVCVYLAVFFGTSSTTLKLSTDSMEGTPRSGVLNILVCCTELCTQSSACLRLPDPLFADCACCFQNPTAWDATWTVSLNKTK